MRGHISEIDLAELILPHIDDPITWVQLAQVSRRFNKVSKTKLVCKELIDNVDRITNRTNLVIFKYYKNDKLTYIFLLTNIIRLLV